jgi:S-DNA-T family DNA segregation ATPase FtsK/SpoIIIE
MHEKMNKVLAGLGINGKCILANQHRHLAYFDISLEPRTSIRTLERNAREIALGIRSKTTPIVKVIPEEGVVRLQVAMEDAKPILHKSIYNRTFQVKEILPFILGEDETGNKLVMDMVKNPHLLIAGGTGSGKSVLLHNLIANAIYLRAIKFTNTDLILVDPKRVEFNFYNDPLFPFIHIENTYEGCVEMLEEMVLVMERRYAHMASINVRSVEDDPGLFVFKMIVIDEVSDLILQDKEKHLHDLLITLAQKGRAAGIYIVLATQRPSVDIITGTIKANFPGRIACKTASRIDSKVILDEIGAESLLGRGDAILKNMEHDRVRFQVAYTDENQIKSTYKFFTEYYRAA